MKCLSHHDFSVVFWESRGGQDQWLTIGFTGIRDARMSLRYSFLDSTNKRFETFNLLIITEYLSETEEKLSRAKTHKILNHN